MHIGIVQFHFLPALNTYVSGNMADRWRRTFVVSHLNRDFSSGYRDCAILTWCVCLWCVAECCGSSDRSASWFCAGRHLRKVCKRTLLCFILLAKRLTQAIVVILRQLHVLCGALRLSAFTTGDRTSLYLFILIHTSSFVVFCCLADYVLVHVADLPYQLQTHDLRIDSTVPSAVPPAEVVWG